MKQLNLMIFMMAFIASSSFAQKPKKENPDHKNFYKNVKLETDAYIIEISDAVAQMDYSKFKIRITNKTNDYLIFDGSKCTFKFEHGEYQPKEKPTTINPNDSGTKVLNVSGDSRFHVEGYTFILDGMSLVAATGTTHDAPEFQLPPSVNDFTAGPFKVTLLKLQKETDLTVAQFRAVYTGAQVGLLDPGKLAVRLENGKEFANFKPDYKTKLLEKGDDDKFNAYFKVPANIADMQFATMFITWRNTFQEAPKVPVKGLTTTLEFDAGKTAAANK